MINRRNTTVRVAVLAVLALLSSGAAYADEPGHRHGTAAPAISVASQALEPLGNNCTGSQLESHTGFQIAPACVSTAFGEVGAQQNNPSLLIVKAPRYVRVGQPIKLKVSTRNLVRDRFLGAAAGGYYLESSFLNGAGLTRGHFHSSCRLLTSNEAPAPDRQAVFVATEDGGGGATPDTVTVTLPGLPARGVAQCAVWAGDGSHRIPMMQFANQIPAFDAVRIKVRGRG